MWKRFVPAMMFFAAMLPACRHPLDIPSEFPAPPPPAASTPAPKITYKPDAELEKQCAEIAKEAKGRVGVAAVVIETGDAAFFDADQHFPMQSVYKLPIAMAVMEKVKLGQLDANERVAVNKEDFVRPGQRSPLRDQNPNGGEFGIRELIRMALVEPDGTASDVLLRVIGGPAEVQSYLTQIGVVDMKVANTEKDLDWRTQYDNWATPIAALEVLRSLEAAKSDPCRVPKCIDGLPGVVGENDAMFIWPVYQSLLDSVPGPKRLKGLLPKDTRVAHKTGTGGSRNGVAAATNDIGIIYLPSGEHVAIAVFVSDSAANEPTRETVIAKIAKAVYDKWNK